MGLFASGPGEQQFAPLSFESLFRLQLAGHWQLATGHWPTGNKVVLLLRARLFFALLALQANDRPAWWAKQHNF